MNGTILFLIEEGVGEMNFSIGEMSKLHNISIQTLRYYDQQGLLKPAYINKENGYRYYTINQFIILDLIKQCKLMGLSLNEIKAFMGQDMTPEALVAILEAQQKALAKQIASLEQMKEHIDALHEKVAESLQVALNEIFIKEEVERYYISHECLIRNTEELEIELRKVLSKAERKGSLLGLENTFIASYESVLVGKLVYHQILLGSHLEANKEQPELVCLPKGNYLTLYYDDSYTDNYKYYQCLLDYAKLHDLKVEGDFYEVSIMPKIDDEGKEKSLVKLQIRII